jgi:hypothetical protein
MTENRIAVSGARDVAKKMQIITLVQMRYALIHVNATGSDVILTFMRRVGTSANVAMGPTYMREIQNICLARIVVLVELTVKYTLLITMEIVRSRGVMRAAIRAVMCWRDTVIPEAHVYTADSKGKLKGAPQARQERIIF